MTVLEEAAPVKKRRRRRRRSKKNKPGVAQVVATAVVADAPIESVDEEVPDKPKKKRRRRRRRSKKNKPDAVPIMEPAVEAPAAETSEGDTAAPIKKRKKRRRRSKKKDTAVTTVQSPVIPAPQISAAELQEVGLKPTWGGFIRMRGKTDNGRKWYQEIEPYLAYVLVKENAAVVVNRHTIRRLYGNKEFRRMILERDEYTCYFCKQYGDTIDHLLPRAKGGHTTPDNCVCACNLCNQSKADKDLEVFMTNFDLG